MSEGYFENVSCKYRGTVEISWVNISELDQLHRSNVPGAASKKIDNFKIAINERFQSKFKFFFKTRFFSPKLQNIEFLMHFLILFNLRSGSHDVSVTDGRRNSCIRDEGSLSRSASDSSMTQQQQQQPPTNNNHSQISPNATLLPNHHGSVF